MGAGLPRKLAIPQDRAADVDMVKSYDFAGAIQALRGDDGRLPPSLPGSESPANTAGIPPPNSQDLTIRSRPNSEKQTVLMLRWIRGRLAWQNK